MYPLYIDPGTGSMLFSILIGAAATLYFLARALFIKVKLRLSGGKSSPFTAGPYIIYSEGEQYWNVFKGVLDAFEKRETAVLYLTSSRDDPFFAQSYRYIRGEFIGEGNRAFARLNLVSAGVVLMTTPGLDVYQLKRSKQVKHYAHILHAPSDAVMYRMFGIDYFDSILLTGDYQAKDIRALEKLRGLPEKRLVTVGCTYLDEYAERIKNPGEALPGDTPGDPGEAPHRFTVLVSPSWGKSALLSKYGARLLDPLVKTGWRIVVRPHPQSKKSEAAMLAALEARYGADLEWDRNRENIQALAGADVMISDFSGIIFDFAFLFDKPIIYVGGPQGVRMGVRMDLRPYDADDLADEPWQFRTLREIGIELEEDSLDSIGELIEKARDSEELRAARRAARETAWQFPGEAGERTAAFLIAVNEGEGHA
ncbi:MAG: CDP-glycerol glycerophosphotransferase family protein [Treponema sp.]|jgi:hypothetical protein|nr:CDP-glycerol glycerophosphotransferase family protein [Treponema sp.]